jgi:hypothetical protein
MIQGNREQEIQKTTTEMSVDRDRDTETEAWNTEMSVSRDRDAETETETETGPERCTFRDR